MIKKLTDLVTMFEGIQENHEETTHSTVNIFCHDVLRVGNLNQNANKIYGKHRKEPTQYIYNYMKSNQTTKYHCLKAFKILLKLPGNILNTFCLY